MHKITLQRDICYGYYYFYGITFWVLNIQWWMSGVFYMFYPSLSFLLLSPVRLAWLSVAEQMSSLKELNKNFTCSFVYCITNNSGLHWFSHDKSLNPFMSTWLYVIQKICCAKSLLFVHSVIIKQTAAWKQAGVRVVILFEMASSWVLIQPWRTKPHNSAVCLSTFLRPLILWWI